MLAIDKLLLSISKNLTKFGDSYWSIPLRAPVRAMRILAGSVKGSSNRFVTMIDHTCHFNLSMGCLTRKCSRSTSQAHTRSVDHLSPASPDTGWQVTIDTLERVSDTGRATSTKESVPTQPFTLEHGLEMIETIIYPNIFCMFVCPE